MSAGDVERPQALRRVCDLYDPDVTTLRNLLKEDAFPSHEFCSGHLLTKLRELGLQTTLTLDGMTTKNLILIFHSLERMGGSPHNTDFIPCP